MIRSIVKRCIVLIGVLLFLALFYHIYYYFFGLKSVHLEKADLIVVFTGGGQERQQAAFQLVTQGYAESIAFTSGYGKSDYPCDIENALVDGLKHIFCGQARSTFEDALYTSELVTQEGVKTIILVTNDYHLIRASFLLESVLKKSGVVIYPYGVASDQVKTDDLKVRLRWYFNENIKFWGSYMEMGIYRMVGVLINDYAWVRQSKDAVKKRVLFDGA